MNILQQVRYILFEIKNPISFRIKYLLEKFLKLPILLLNNKFNFSINIPYLFHDDFLIENINGKWINKAKTDYDYTINPYVEKELEKYFHSDGIFFDIGAHVGKWSIFVAGKNKKVYSFEPNPITYSYLLKNIKINELENHIIPLNNGIGKENEKLTFKIDENETSKSKFSKEGNVSVKVISIDEFIKDKKIDISQIDLIKIDTEGFELNVLKGMTGFLGKTKKVSIICEILDSQEDKKEIFNFLKLYGFNYKKLETPADYLFYKKI